MAAVDLPPFPKKGVSLRLMQAMKNIVASVNKSLTTTDVCNFFIKPITKDDQCAFMDFDFKKFSCGRNAEALTSGRFFC